MPHHTIWNEHVWKYNNASVLQGYFGAVGAFLELLKMTEDSWDTEENPTCKPEAAVRFQESHIL